MKREPINQIVRSGQSAPLVVGTLCFALMLAGLVWYNRSLHESPPVPPTASLEPSPPVSDTVRRIPVQLEADEPVTVALADEPVETVTAGEQPVSGNRDESVAARIEGHLAAGEIGAAADLAVGGEGISRDELLARIVHAQVNPANQEQNEQADQAPVQLPQMFSSGSREARAEAARQRMLAGAGADFESLIELIQNQTSGPWEEIEGIGGTIEEFESGVRVDPQGVLYQAARQETSGKLAALGTRARMAALNEDMARPATLRLVSLTRLEREIARRLEAGQPVVASMKHLAGLSQIQYIFIYPEEGEIVLGGPAEGWQYNEYGMAVGVDSGRPTLQLDDLVTVLRTFSDDGMQIFGCSIDPKPENIKAVKEFAAESQAKGPLSPGGVRNWASKIRNLLGLQDITVYGVPADSRVARVLVEADYRMKLIGIGKMDAGSNIPNYFDLLAKDPSLASGGLDALRWWMTMKYDEVLHSGDQNAFEIRGSAVRCQSENQFLSDQGERINTGKAEPINQLFAANFTRHYLELAERDPIFADLQGIFDLALVAALIHRDQLDEKTGWNRGAFRNDGAYRPATYAVPNHVESVVNHRVYNGQDVVLQVAGGVRGDIAAVLDEVSMKASPRLGPVADQAKAAALPSGRWWWDAR
jgi:hypothetical protein